jgi:hypothetical protein
MYITLSLSTSILSEYYFVGIYFNAFHYLSCFCSNNKCPDDQEDSSSWDTWYLHQEITYECICASYATADADEEDIILHEEGSVESEYEDDFAHGDNYGNGYGVTY